MYNYRFLLIFDAARCLANGDPETGLQRLIGDRALISQYCIKNKVKKYLAENNITDLEGLKRFNSMGYKYSDVRSEKNNYVFIKE